MQRLPLQLMEIRIQSIKKHRTFVRALFEGLFCFYTFKLNGLSADFNQIF